MTRDDALLLLKTRSALTSQPYGDGAVIAWHDALVGRPFDECRSALIAAARDTQRVTIAHLVERLPQRASTPAAPPEHCELCAGSGYRTASQAEAHRPDLCHPTADRPCYCTGVLPCRCSTGRRMVDPHRRIVEHNERGRRSRAEEQPAPAPERQPTQDDLGL